MRAARANMFLESSGFSPAKSLCLRISRRKPHSQYYRAIPLERLLITVVPLFLSHAGATMKNKLVLCRTRLEEAASCLRELVISEPDESDSRLKVATALAYVEKAIDALRPDPARGRS